MVNSAQSREKNEGTVEMGLAGLDTLHTNIHAKIPRINFYNSIDAAAMFTYFGKLLE